MDDEVSLASWRHADDSDDSDDSDDDTVLTDTSNTESKTSRAETTKPTTKTKTKKTKKKKKNGSVSINTYNFRGNLDLLHLCLEQDLGNWREDISDSGEWRRASDRADILWVGNNIDNMRHGGIRDLADVRLGQSVSRIDGMRELMNKNTCAAVLTRLKRVFPDDFRFHPLTWCLPEDAAKLSAHIRAGRKGKKGKPKPTYICKPAAGSEGNGITLCQSVNDIFMPGSNELRQGVSGGRAGCVVQDYVSRPLFVAADDGPRLKFDLRLYVLVTSVSPLRVFLCTEGLARFCTEEYEAPAKHNLRSSYAHLTNYSLNKRNTGNYVHTGEGSSDSDGDGGGGGGGGQSDSDCGGSKRTLTSVMRALTEQGCDTAAMWDSVCELVANTMTAVAPRLAMQYRQNFGETDPDDQRSAHRCFQILGFDVLFDEDEQCHLLEVNSNPSMRIDYEVEVEPGSGIEESLPSPIDEAVKRPMLTDALRIARAFATGNQESLRLREGYCFDEGGLSEESKHDDGKETEEESMPLQYVEVECDARLAVFDRLRLVFQRCTGSKCMAGMTSSQFSRLGRRIGALSDGAWALSTAEIDISFIRATGGHGGPKSMSLEAFFDVMEDISARFFPDDSAADALENLADLLSE